MPTWTLKTKFTFDSAHFIEGYDGKCGRMHGHTYTVEMIAKSNKLNPSKWLKTPDMVCDFNELKWPGKDALKGGLDHGVLNDLMEVNTTAERIAEFIHQETMKRVPEGIRLRVILWETPTSCVEYTDEDE
jgi:6-pyruvoyltetrahydropterin/6-carboxytetrahydropterin synthase